MDDCKSDNTDELLTSIDPLIFQSERIINEKDYKLNAWNHESNQSSTIARQAIIVDDIFSARSMGTMLAHPNEKGSLFKSPTRLSETNVKVHNSVQHQDDSIDSNRSASTNLYEASASAQTTPRNISGVNKFINGYQQQYDVQGYLSSTPTRYDMMDDSSNGDKLRREIDQSQRHISVAMPINYKESRSEIQRMQLTNKQLSTQLQEAKLSIQTLSIQLEQVQQECKHKESTLENLDNTLGRLVAGWKKRDCQKEQEIDNLNKRIEAKNNVINESQKSCDESKVALSNAMKSLSMEKIKFEQLEKNLSFDIDNLKTERSQFITDNKNLAQRIVFVESELKKMKDICIQKNNSLEMIKQQTCEEKQFLENNISHFKHENERLKEESINSQLENQIKEDKIDQLRHEMKALEEELLKGRKEIMEKDSYSNELKTKIRTMAEEHSLGLRKLEKDLQVKFQHELNSSLSSVNEQHKKSLQKHTNDFQIKLNEQSKRHRLELDRLRQVAEQEITSRLSDNQETISMLRARLDRSEKSVQFWQQEKESVEKARNQISTRLYEIMKLGYRSSDQEPIKYQGSAFDQPYHNNAPKGIDSTSYLFNLANNSISHNTLANNFFEPIKLDSKSSSISTGVGFYPKSSPYSVMSDAPNHNNHNLALTSSINTALSY